MAPQERSGTKALRHSFVKVNYFLSCKGLSELKVSHNEPPLETGISFSLTDLALWQNIALPEVTVSSCPRCSLGWVLQVRLREETS